jgi:metal-responsive CopG/Arc/MetJ family transcriptional regulator
LNDKRVLINIDEALLNNIDTYCKTKDISRSAFLRQSARVQLNVVKLKKLLRRQHNQQQEHI